jgi:hypothetical protein
MKRSESGTPEREGVDPENGAWGRNNEKREDGLVSRKKKVLLLGPKRQDVGIGYVRTPIDKRL